MPAEPVEFLPEAILGVLIHHEVDCVVIGGIGAYLQGSPFITADVDITPRVGRDNFERLSSALTELDAKIRADTTEPLPFNHDADSLMAVAVWNLTTKFGDLDITTTPSGTAGYDDLRRDAITIELGMGKLMVASLGDIVRSKGAAGRDKDLRVLPLLRDLLAEQTRAGAEARRRKR